MGSRQGRAELREARSFVRRASTAFGDPLSVTINDPQHSAGEHRFVLFGLSQSGRLLAVAHVDRDGTTRIMTKIVQADLARSDHQEAVVAMTAAYALDTMGNGGPLSPEVLARLVPGLRAHPTTLVFLAYVDEVPVGIATCFLGFSTFAARPLINIHDLAVLPEHRGRGIGGALLRAVEVAARERGCVKVTLEVQENNRRARHLYERAGLAQAGYGAATGGSLFFSKNLTDIGDTQPAVTFQNPRGAA